MMKKYQEYLKWAIFFVVIALIGGTTKSNFTLDILISTIFFCSMAAAWNIVGGYAGLVSLGHVAFMGIGSYISTILFLNMGLSPWIGMFVGSIGSMLLAYLIGMLTIRLQGPFLVLSTMALASILQIFAIKFDKITGGSVGLSIPYKPSFYNMVFKSYNTYFILFVLLLAAVIAVTIFIKNSRMGSYLIAIREDELAAAALGINVFKTKLNALLLSAFFTSIGGSLYVQYMLFMDPASAFSPAFSTKVAVLTIIGGAGTVLGPVVGGMILVPVEIFLRIALGSTYQGAYLLVYGILLIVVILVIPDGIVGLFKRKLAIKFKSTEKKAKLKIETE